MAVDWLFAPTDNVNLIIEVAVGLIATAWVAGWWSKQKLQAWLSSPASDPYIDRIVGRVVAGLPAFPTVEKIVDALPEMPNYDDRLSLLEERIGSKLSASIDSKWSGLEDQLSTRVGLVVQAHIASAKNSFSAGMKELEDMSGGENDGSVLTEVLGIFMDSDSIKKVGRAKSLFKRMQGQGGLGLGNRGNNGGGSPQGGYPFGTVVNGYVATPQGWVPIQRPQPQLPPSPPPAGTGLPAAASAPPSLPPELPAEPKKTP